MSWSVRISSEAMADLESIKAYLSAQFGTDVSERFIRDIMKDIKKLKDYPNIDIKLFERFDIVTDYKCFYTHKNYVFYRIEGDKINIIRVLDHRRDFLFTLFGPSMKEDDYSDEE